MVWADGEVVGIGNGCGCAGGACRLGVDEPEAGDGTRAGLVTPPPAGAVALPFVGGGWTGSTPCATGWPWASIPKPPHESRLLCPSFSECRESDRVCSAGRMGTGGGASCSSIGIDSNGADSSGDPSSSSVAVACGISTVRKRGEVTTRGEARLPPDSAERILCTLVGRSDVVVVREVERKSGASGE